MTLPRHELISLATVTSSGTPACPHAFRVNIIAGRVAVMIAGPELSQSSGTRTALYLVIDRRYSSLMSQITVGC